MVLLSRVRRELVVAVIEGGREEEDGDRVGVGGHTKETANNFFF